MAEQEHLIDIQDVYDKFERHLKLPNNTNILFSGRFGIGKTFFLKKFFEQNKDYNAVFISPVNYVVHPNESIFKLIKADIIKGLIEKKIIKPDKIDLSALTKLDFAQWFIIEKWRTIGRKGVNVFSRLSAEAKITDAVFEFVEAFSAKLEGYAKEKNEPASNAEKIEDYAQQVYEELIVDSITQWIEEILKTSKSKKENILVIDDLDRLDPDHIFRILNILSTHNYDKGEKIKFGFDKIIIVCDLENIEKIFYHKYGIGVDFDGYLDKFYFLYPFNFSNRDAVISFVEHKLSGSLSSHSKKLLTYLLTFIDDIAPHIKEYNHNLRKILKGRYIDEIRFTPHGKRRMGFSFNYKADDFYNISTNGIDHDSEKIELFKIIKILSVIMGGQSRMYEIFKRIHTSDIHKIGSYSVTIRENIDIMIPIIAANIYLNGDFGFTDSFNTNRNSYRFDITLPDLTMVNRFSYYLAWNKVNVYMEDEEFIDISAVEIHHTYTANNPVLYSRSLISHIYGLLNTYPELNSIIKSD